MPSWASWTATRNSRIAEAGTKSVSDFVDGPQKQLQPKSAQAIVLDERCWETAMCHGQMWGMQAGSWSILNHGNLFDQAYLGVVEELENATSSGTVRAGQPFWLTAATLSVDYSLLLGPSPPLQFAVTPQGLACGPRELVTRNKQAFRLRHAGRCVMHSWLRLSARRLETRQHHGGGRLYGAASLPGVCGVLCVGCVLHVHGYARKRGRTEANSAPMHSLDLRIHWQSYRHAWNLIGWCDQRQSYPNIFNICGVLRWAFPISVSRIFGRISTLIARLIFFWEVAGRVLYTWDHWVVDERKSHFYSEYKLLKSVPKIGGLRR